MLASRTFFSFTEVPDPADHRAYNEWHQLDHRPENLALPGVVHGERWVRSPDCAAAGPPPDPLLAELHYLNMYWFGEPVAAATAAWSELAERAFHWGRRDDVHLANRLLMGFFVPIEGYVHERVRVCADALPFRPTRGIHATLTRVDRPRDPDAERLFGWYDRVRVPQLLTLPGAAGIWTFASDDTFGTALDLTGEQSPPSLRLTLVYLDDDPLAFTEALDDPPADHPAADVETTLFAGPLRTIIPWQWDWFDRT